MRIPFEKMVGDGDSNEGSDGKVPGSSAGRTGRVGERGEEYIEEGCRSRSRCRGDLTE